MKDVPLPAQHDIDREDDFLWLVEFLIQAVVTVTGLRTCGLPSGGADKRTNQARAGVASDRASTIASNTRRMRGGTGPRCGR